MSPDRQSAHDWAAQASVATPVRWGEIEAEVLSRPVSVERGPAERVLRTVGAVGLAAIALPVVNAALMGLLLVLNDGPPAFQRLAFLLALGLPLALLLTWWERRTRELVPVLLCVGALVASIVLLPRTDVDAWTRGLAVASCVTALAVSAVMLLASRRSPRRTRGHRWWSLDPATDLAYLQSRATVLDVLRQRRTVALSDEDRDRMLAMPLGSWARLDETGAR